MFSSQTAKALLGCFAPDCCNFPVRSAGGRDFRGLPLWAFSSGPMLPFPLISNVVFMQSLNCLERKVYGVAFWRPLGKVLNYNHSPYSKRSQVTSWLWHLPRKAPFGWDSRVLPKRWKPGWDSLCTATTWARTLCGAAKGASGPWHDLVGEDLCVIGLSLSPSKEAASTETREPPDQHCCPAWGWGGRGLVGTWEGSTEPRPTRHLRWQVTSHTMMCPLETLGEWPRTLCSALHGFSRIWLWFLRFPMLGHSISLCLPTYPATTSETYTPTHVIYTPYNTYHTCHMHNTHHTYCIHPQLITCIHTIHILSYTNTNHTHTHPSHMYTHHTTHTSIYTIHSTLIHHTYIVHTHTNLIYKYITQAHTSHVYKCHNTHWARPQGDRGKGASSLGRCVSFSQPPSAPGSIHAAPHFSTCSLHPSSDISRWWERSSPWSFLLRSPHSTQHSALYKQHLQQVDIDGLGLSKRKLIALNYQSDRTTEGLPVF